MVDLYKLDERRLEILLFVAQKQVQESLCGISNNEFYLRDVTCLVHAYEEPLLSFEALICKNEIILF